MTYDVVIIGAGLGGLECGYILARHGMSVCVLEKNPHVGGCLQTFERRGTTFDTGFHFVGGLDEGQPLHRLFRYFGLLDLPWHRLDQEAFAEVVIGGRSYQLPGGYRQFVDTLSEQFPSHRNELRQYVQLLREVGENVEATLRPGMKKNDAVNSWFELSAYDFLRSTISDPTLLNVLSGASLTMEPAADTLPLYVFAQINNSAIQSSWRLQGGGHRISSHLADSIMRMGGNIVCNARADRLVERNGSIVAVEYNGGECVETRHVISDLHPALTLSLLSSHSAVRPIYRRRINNLPDTCGMFTTHLQLRPDCMPYLNRNVFVYENDELWQKASSCGLSTDRVMISYQVPTDGTFTRNIDLLTPMRWDEVTPWDDTSVGRRGDAYRDFKARKAEECIRIASKRLPELRESIEHVYTSTPLTYRDYTGTRRGSAYGIRKDCNNVLQTLLSPSTPLPNLLLTGQSLNLHGVLGVTMTAFVTCAALLGMDEATKGLW